MFKCSVTCSFALIFPVRMNLEKHPGSNNFFLYQNQAKYYLIVVLSDGLCHYLDINAECGKKERVGYEFSVTF